MLSSGKITGNDRGYPSRPTFTSHRAHAEFQLNKEPNYPFWFTPAQFMGRLIISKNGSRLEYFEMHVPTDKALNVGEAD